MKHLNLISYFGGKYPHLEWLINLFPKGNYHFIDIMCGSANVALNVNYPLITINDINDDVVNLFTVLRENHEEFLRQIYFTPFSRAELYKIIDNYNDEVSDLEKARRFYTRSQLGFGANGSQNLHKGAGFEYSLQRTKFYRVDNWNAKLDKLAAVVDKLRRMQIESRSVFELFEKVDKPTSVIYIDPPYLLQTRKSKKRYRFDVDDTFHHQLAELIKDSKALIAVSGYNSEMYDQLFSGFYKTIGPLKASTISKKPVAECLWTNYNPETINNQHSLQFPKS